MKHLNILLCALLPAIATAQQVPAAPDDVRTGIHFNTASAEIDAEDRAALSDLCARIGDREAWSVKLSGHTDAVGSNAYNQDLSRRRVEAVRAALAEACPELTSTDIDWRGETKPVASNADETGRALNRRVDVIIGFEENEAYRPSINDARSVTGVTPLFPEADKKADHYSMDASKAIDITTPEGWKVHIDANTMVDAQGRPVTGPVEISCRAFFTPAEAIASGIPMYVGQRDDAGHMESAGMFEVLAFANNEPLALKPGHTITIERPVERVPGADYNDYMLDPATGEWEQQDAPALLSTTMQQAIPMVADVRSNNTGIDSLAAWWVYQQNRGRVPRMPDTLSFSGRRGDENYCLTSRCRPLPDEKGAWKGRVISTDYPYRVPEIHLRVDRRFLRDHGKLAFRIRMQTGWLHPEWAAFGGEKLWVYDGPMDRKAFISDIATKHLYQDIELVALEGEDHGTLRLKSQGEWVDLPIDLSSYRHTKSDAIVWARQLDTYHRRMVSKERQFNSHLRSVNSSIARRIANEEASAYAQARRRMRPDELAMDKATWIEDCGRRFAFYQARMIAAARAADPMYDDRVAGSTVLARFTMSGFGIYNCDRIMPREAVPTAVAVVDEKGEPFRWHTAYGVVDGRTAVITYWGNGSGSEDRMLLSSEMTSMLFVGKGNELLVVERPTRQCQGKQKATMHGKRATEPTTKEELEALVSL